ncbi:MAG TPA: hypothetical protein VGN26_15725 [Armatimonadota bacterium]|jgi:hypothetical protein
MLALAVVLSLASPRGVSAMAQRYYPLREVIADTPSILLGRVVVADRDDLRAVLVLDEPLKGKAPLKWMGIDLRTGGWGHPSILSRRLAPGMPVVVFLSTAASRRVAICFANDTWFKATAPLGAIPDRQPWGLADIEVHLARTFSGKAEALAERVKAIVSGQDSTPDPEPRYQATPGPVDLNPNEAAAEYHPDRPLPPLPAFLQHRAAAPSIALHDIEAMRILRSTLASADPIWHIPPVRGRHRYFFRSAGTTLVATGRTGQKLELALQVGVSARYDLHLVVAGSSGVGKIGLSLDGKPLPEPNWPKSGPARAAELPGGETTAFGSVSGMAFDSGAPPATLVFRSVSLKAGDHVLAIAPTSTEGSFWLSLDALGLVPTGGIQVLEADRKALSSARIPQAGVQRALTLARDYYKPVREVAELARQARGNWHDVEWALYLERAFGRGGPRAIRRSAMEILGMRLSDPWYTWSDICGAFNRGGEIYMPTKDSGGYIYQLRRRFSWDDLDPTLMGTKFSGVVLEDWVKQQDAARLRSPLAEGEARGKQLSPSGSATADWSPLAESTSNCAIPTRSAIVPVPEAPDKQVSAAPPATGVLLPGDAGRYDGKSVWFSRPAPPNGVAAAGGCEGSTVKVGPREGVYLVEAQIYVPDHVEEVGEPRGGLLAHIMRPCRRVDVGVRFRDAATGAWVGQPAPQPGSGGGFRGWPGQPSLAADLPGVEPVIGAFDTVRLRVRITREGEGYMATVAAFQGNGPEVSRARVLLPAGPAQLEMVPALRLGVTGLGYVPECYVTSVAVYEVQRLGA